MQDLFTEIPDLQFVGAQNIRVHVVHRSVAVAIAVVTAVLKTGFVAFFNSLPEIDGDMNTFLVVGPRSWGIS